LKIHTHRDIPIQYNTYEIYISTFYIKIYIYSSDGPITSLAPLERKAHWLTERVDLNIIFDFSF